MQRIADDFVDMARSIVPSEFRRVLQLATGGIIAVTRRYAGSGNQWMESREDGDDHWQND